MRWADLDLLGHVNNAVYGDYLQEARIDMIRTLGASHATEATSEADGLVVVRTRVDYLRPLLFRLGTVRVETYVEEIRPATFTLAYEVVDDPAHGGPGDDRIVYVRARTVLTPFRFASETPRRLTDEERARLEPYLEPGQEPRTPAVAPASGQRSAPGHLRVPVRFSDVDAYGHVNNVTYLEYLQEGRIELIGRLWGAAPGAPAEQGRPGPALVVARAELDYRVPMVPRAEPYDVHTTIERIGRTSMTFGTEIVDATGEAETCCARGRVVVVFVDRVTGRPVQPDEEDLRPLRELGS
ncbi:thioesterase family protein [Nocardioides acrostichi]|nr:thioesterase family protein [Nocardioides acrostichi]